MPKRHGKAPAGNAPESKRSELQWRECIARGLVQRRVGFGMAEEECGGVEKGLVRRFSSVHHPVVFTMGSSSAATKGNREGGIYSYFGAFHN